MKKTTSFFLLVVCIFLLSACVREASTPTFSGTCTLMLDIYIRQGPNVGDKVSGSVEFGNEHWNSFKGDFAQENGSKHPVSFSFDWQSLHFLLDLDQGQVFADGIMESGLAECSGKGGGTLSGPSLGDLGDWRGRWIRGVNSSPQPQPTKSQETSSGLFSSVPILGCLVLVIFLWLALTIFERLKRVRRKKTAPALRKTRPVPGGDTGDRKPLAEYLATYTEGDKLFDLSFEIEKGGQYRGECGITIANASNDKSGPATAFEFWLFDAKDVQTASKVLIGEFGYNQEDLRRELEAKGEGILLRPGENIILETKTLRANARILQAEYDPKTTHPNSVFKKMVLSIAVWEKLA